MALGGAQLDLVSSLWPWTCSASHPRRRLAQQIPKPNCDLGPGRPAVDARRGCYLRSCQVAYPVWPLTVALFRSLWTALGGSPVAEAVGYGPTSQRTSPDEQRHSRTASDGAGRSTWLAMRHGATAVKSTDRSAPEGSDGSHRTVSAVRSRH